MALGMAEIVQQEPIKAPARFPMEKRKKNKITKHERTECNYLIMFFVVGVLTLAMTDITASCRR